MPIYEYECEGCAKIFEEHQSFSDKPLTKCRECGGKLKKIFSPAGIIFKGSGFHVTDYGKKKDSSSVSAQTAAGKKASPSSAADTK